MIISNMNVEAISENSRGREGERDKLESKTREE